MFNVKKKKNKEYDIRIGLKGRGSVAVEHAVYTGESRRRTTRDGPGAVGHTAASAVVRVLCPNTGSSPRRQPRTATYTRTFIQTRE